MSDSVKPVRVLVVCDRPETTPVLLDAICERARRGPSVFHVLVPNPARAEWHPRDFNRRDGVVEAEAELALQVPLLRVAAGVPVHGSVSIRHDVMDAVEEAQVNDPFDEIILITVPHEIERRLHVDLPHRLKHLGVPVSAVQQVSRSHEHA